MSNEQFDEIVDNIVDNDVVSARMRGFGYDVLADEIDATTKVLRLAFRGWCENNGRDFATAIRNAGGTA